MEESRTKNTLSNVKTGALVQIVNKIMVFAVRTVFIKMLNTEYLGVNGLFTNVLAILSFAEIGIGTAIIFNMYKPVAEKDYEKIKSLMQLYKKAYTLIGIVIFVLGLCVIPFMNIVIKETPNISENLILIYVMFLSNTAISYFYTYKKSIISAHQKQSIINKIDSVVYLIKSIVEIVVLILTKNYLIYLLIEIISTLSENIVVSKKADKMYPYLRDKKVKKISKSESKSIFNNVKSLIVYKFGAIIMNSTDNILTSMLINVSTVGYCSNYTMIISAVNGILASALNGITASVGNLNVCETREKKSKIFYQITFVNYVIYSFCTVAFIVLLNPFIELWLGTEYVLNINVSIALALSFFINGLRNPGYTFRTTLGLFNKGKIAPYIGATTNILLSVVLCKSIGVTGIFLATSIATLLSYSWIDPYLIHKYEFKTSIKGYLKKYVKYFLIFSICTITSLVIANSLKFHGVFGFVIKILIVCIIPNLLNFVVFHKSEEYIELNNKIIEPWKKKARKVLARF